MDVIFYFVISMLIATVLCYFIFWTKNGFQREDIEKEISAMKTVGTDQQKQYEQQVLSYKQKISDFSSLLKKHKFTSNVFSFIERQTMPNIWFKQFSLDGKNATVQLSGEADSMDAFSRQVAALESSDNKKYIKNVGVLNSTLGNMSRIEFSMSITLNQNIFGYLSPDLPGSDVTSQESQPQDQQGQ